MLFQGCKKCNKKSNVVSMSNRGSRGELSNQLDKHHHCHQQLANLHMSPLGTDVTQEHVNQPNLVNAPMVNDSDSEDKEDRKNWES